MRRYNFMLVAACAMGLAILAHLVMMAPWLYALIILAGLCFVPLLIKVFSGFVKGMRYDD